MNIITEPTQSFISTELQNDCSECGSTTPPFVEMKLLPGAQLLPMYCLNCLRAAVQLLEQAQEQKPTISTIQDRILAAIDNTSAGYLAAWHICDWLEIDRLQIQGHKYPQNDYEWALAKLVNGGVLEEISDLSYRYRRITP